MYSPYIGPPGKRSTPPCMQRTWPTYKDNMIRPVPSCALVCHRAKECALLWRAVLHLPLTFWTCDANSFRHCAFMHGLLPARRQGSFAQRILHFVNECRRSTLTILERIGHSSFRSPRSRGLLLHAKPCQYHACGNNPSIM